MICAVFDYHKKLFKRNPIVITVVMFFVFPYMVDRYQDVYRINHDVQGFLIESFGYYFAAFHFMPAFFNRDNFEKTDDQFSEKMRRQDSGSERMQSISRHHGSSTSSCYDHNRNSPSSSLHNSSLGRGFL